MKPLPKPLPAAVGPTMKGIRTDEQLATFINSSKPGTAVVEFGTSWCLKCHEMFPQFYLLSKQVILIWAVAKLVQPPLIKFASYFSFELGTTMSRCLKDSSGDLPGL